MGKPCSSLTQVIPRVIPFSFNVAHNTHKYRNEFKLGLKVAYVRRVITLRDALRDFLKDAGLELSDLLAAMDEDPEGIIESLLKRVDISEEEARKLELAYSPHQLNLLILVLHVFYFANPSGYYKGYLIYPPRESVVGPTGKITREGLRLIIRSLGLTPGVGAF